MSQTRTTPSPTGSTASPSVLEATSLGRRIARTLLALWWILVSSAAPVVIPLLPDVLVWARALPLTAQVALSLFGIAASALMGWLTYLAWRHQQRQTAVKGAASSTQHAEAVKDVVDPRSNAAL